MGYEKAKIVDIVEAIDKKQIYLPAIQRKYVWSEEQITNLMDSIMRGYPFGTFLFWKVKKTTINEKLYSLYEFIKDYHERDQYINQRVAPFFISEGHEDECVLSVLDGQQRLTSLYIALKGSLSNRVRYGRKNDDNAYPKRELYFNLLSGRITDDDDAKYSFAFLTEEAANAPATDKVWYKVKNIVQYPDLKALNRLILGSDWGTNETAVDNITTLFQRITNDELINYFEQETESMDEVLDIFVRVNQNGTVLSKTDLLFSTIVSHWIDGRDKIDELLKRINKTGERYNFTNDFIMRTCLYVIDLPTKLKVEAFQQDNVRKIRYSWSNIESAITDTVNVLNDLGFSEDNIISYNAIIPLVYYRYKNGQEAFADLIDPSSDEVILDEKMEVRKYLVAAQIRHIFGQSTNTTLEKIRTKMSSTIGNKFKLADLYSLSFGDRDLVFDESDIEDWIDTFEKNEYTFMLLSLLYPNLKYGQNGFHQDHMHPYSAFESLSGLQTPAGAEAMSPEKAKEWKRLRNTLPNLQLLEGRENKSKNDVSLDEWLNDAGNRENAKYLPDVDYSLANFDEFYKERKDLMLNELKRILL